MYSKVRDVRHVLASNVQRNFTDGQQIVHAGEALGAIENGRGFCRYLATGTEKLGVETSFRPLSREKMEHVNGLGIEEEVSIDGDTNLDR